MADQAKGSTAVVLFGWESSFNTQIAEGSRKPRQIKFNTLKLSKSRALNWAETLRGNRNPASPYRGNVEVGGSMSVPVSLAEMGFWLKALIGEPSTSESAGSDHKSGSPTCTISNGVLTTSVAQTNAVVNDRITYDTSKECWIKQINSTTEFVVVDQYGHNTIADEVAAVNIDDIKTVTYTHEFKVDPTAEIDSFVLDRQFTGLDIPKYELFTGLKIDSATLEVLSRSDEELLFEMSLQGANMTQSSDVSEGGTIAVSSGTATFSVSQDDAAVGDIVVYTSAAGVKTLAYITAIGSPTSMTIKTTRSGSTNPPDTSAVSLTAILHDAKYDGHADDAPATYSGTRFNNKDGSVKVDNVTNSLLTRISVEFNNNLDGTTYTIGGGGVRRRLAEGLVEAGGSFTALFEDDSFLVDAANETEKKIEVILTQGNNSLTFEMAEAQISEKTAEISGPGGLLLELDWTSYYDNHANESCVVATLVNNFPASYAN